MIDIVQEHFEELDFLWELREGVIFAPDWNLAELAELEERAEAHLDGLRLAELHAVDIARPHLAGEHTFGATAATFVFMETGDADLIAEVVAALEAAEAPARDGIRIGLRHSRIDAVEKRLYELAASGPSALRAAAADVLAFHRRRLPDIEALLGDDDDAVRVLAFGALGRGSSPLEPALVTAGLQSKSAAVRRAVLEAAARSGTPGLDLICRQAATRAADPDDEALAFLGVLGKPQDFALLKSALQRPELAIAAVRGLGALGRVESIPLLLEAMERPSTAAEAGSAFQRITGASDFTSEEASDVPANPEAEFAEVAPSPDPELARQVWQAMRRDLDPKESVQDGHRISTATTRSELDRFSLRTRRDLYLSARASAKASAVVELEHRSVLQRE